MLRVTLIGAVVLALPAFLVACDTIVTSSSSRRPVLRVAIVGAVVLALFLWLF